jgi:HD-GYP domain-containing protein (c-di-GMP phosphodiesterase class II)
VISTPTQDLQPGDVLAETVLAEDGSVLLAAGVSLTTSYIAGIRRRGVLAVNVRDGLADDVVPDLIVSRHVRAQVASNVARLCGGLNAAAVAASADGDGSVGAVGTAIERLGERPLGLDSGTAGAFQRAQEDVVALIDAVLCAASVGSLVSLKTHNEYTFQHSVDVAVIGALLGHWLGLQQAQLQDLVLGCLVHDVGKTFIDVAILDKAGPLTDEERAEVQRHPRMGFELLRRAPLASILPAHVAYQHHERQDGLGYPRGLVGCNRVLRSDADRLGGRTMALIAEIAAVADVHSALTSDRPYRAALPADEADGILAGMAGTHLNAEVVGVLRRSAPLHPVGTWVEVLDGPAGLVGWRGVVTRVADARRPQVRFLVDAAGAVRPPREVDLRVREDVVVRSLPAGAHPTGRLLVAADG